MSKIRELCGTKRSDFNEWLADQFEESWMDDVYRIKSPPDPKAAEPDPVLVRCRCGGDAELSIENDGHTSMDAESDHAYVQCQTCGMRTKSVYEDYDAKRGTLKAAAARLWNAAMGVT